MKILRLLIPFSQCLIIFGFLSCRSFLTRETDNEISAKKEIESLIEDLHHRAQEHMDESRFDQAQAVLDSIISIKPHAAAYLKLGKIYAMRKGEHKTAEMYYKRAMELKYHYAEAYYRLAMLYKNGPFPKQAAIDLLRWTIRYNRNLKDAYYQRAILLMQYNRAFISGLRELEKLMLIDPEYKECYRLYRRVIFAFHKFNRMSGFLHRLISAYPNNHNYRLDLILALNRARKYWEARGQLELLKKHSPNVSRSLMWLYEARNLFALHQDTLAHELYRNGIKTISSEEESREFFYDIIFLVTDKEYDSFTSGALPEKKRCMTIFWKSRDPILVTPYNERLSEHFARLRYARKHFKRNPVKELFAFFMNDDTESVERVSPTVFTRFSATKGSQLQQEIDDCGLIYIRHGEPDDQETFLSLTSNTNLSWLYHARDDRPAMIFHFRYMKGNWGDGYRLELRSKYNDERFFVTWGSGPESIKRGIESIKLGTSTSTTNVEPPHGLFDFPFSYYCFKGEGNLENLYFYYDLPREALPDTKVTTQFGLRHEMVLFNSNWDEIQRIERTDSAASLKFDLNHKITRKIVQQLPAGVYFSGLQLTNTQTKQQGNLKILLRIPSTRPPGLKMTNILLADEKGNETLLRIEEYEHSIAGILAPNVERTFQKDRRIVVYFEVYNLQLSRIGRSDFTVSLQITQRKKYASTLSKFYSRIRRIFTKEDYLQITVEDDYSGEDPDEFITRTIVLPDYVPGEYELKISVTDRIIRTKITKSVDFKIIE